MVLPSPVPLRFSSVPEVISDALVVTFSDDNCLDPRLVGGKGASLAALKVISKNAEVWGATANVPSSLPVGKRNHPLEM